MSLTQTLRQRLAPQTDQQRDAEHIKWINTNEGLAEVIKFPILGIVPSERTDDQRREVLLSDSKKYRVEH